MVPPSALAARQLHHRATPGGDAPSCNHLPSGLRPLSLREALRALREGRELIWRMPHTTAGGAGVGEATARNLRIGGP